MKTVLAMAAASILAPAILVACGESDGSSAFEPDDASADVSAADVARPDASLIESGTADASVIDAETRPPFDAAAPSVTCAVSPCITAIVAGDQHYCATDSNGAIRCWGNPTPLGAFVDNPNDPNAGATPVVLQGLADVVDIAATAQNTCVVHAAGSVDCFGQAGPTPTPLENVSNAKKLALGDQRSCVVKTNGELFCWGWSWGWGTDDLTMPLAGEQAIAAAAGQSVGFAVGSTGTLYSWGSDLRLLGRKTPYSPDQTPAPVMDIPTVLQVVTSNGSALALGSDGRLFGWGANTNGVLGSGALVAALTPEEVPFDVDAWPSRIAMSSTHGCARMTDGTLFCWGATNGPGQLGYESKTGSYVPAKVDALARGVVTVAVGKASTCAVLDDGSVQCWGDNSYGQLGQGTRDGARHASPVTVVFH